MPASILEAPLLPPGDDDLDCFVDQEDHFFQPIRGKSLRDDCCCSSKESSPASIFTVAKLAASFFCVYSAMDALSEYITSLLPGGLGDESLFLLQAALCASTLAAPTIVSILGELRSMMLGGVAHSIYLAALAAPNRFTVLGSSALCGFGASLTWVAQGTFLTKCTPPSKRGLFTGVFWGIYSLSSVAGNLAAFVIFKFLPPSAMFGLGSVNAAIGVCVLFFVEDVKPTDRDSLLLRAKKPGDGDRDRDRGEKPDEEEFQLESPRKCSRCLDEELNPPAKKDGLIWKTLLHFLLLFPITCYIGFQAAFWTGEFTKLLPASTIGIVLLFTGIGQVIGSFCLSWLSDYLGCATPTFLVGAVASGVGLVTCFPLQSHRSRSNYEIQGVFGTPVAGAPLLAYVAGLLFGIADGVLTSHVFAITARIFHGKRPEIWAMFNLLGTAGAATTFWIGILFPISNSSGITLQIRIQLAVLFIGSPLYVILDLLSPVAKVAVEEHASVMVVPVAA